MGGYGSTRWGTYTKKYTVEDCRELSVFDLCREGVIGPNACTRGAWAWWNSRTGERTASICYAVKSVERGYLLLTLSYTFTGEAEPVNMGILIEPTRPHFGGVRYWFRCPLIVSGNRCLRRVGKLFLPPRGRYFGCRRCYGLAYRSSQDSRKVDPLARLLTRANGWDFEETKRIMNRIGRGSGSRGLARIRRASLRR